MGEEEERGRQQSSKWELQLQASHVLFSLFPGAAAKGVGKFCPGLGGLSWAGWRGHFPWDLGEMGGTSPAGWSLAVNTGGKWEQGTMEIYGRPGTICGHSVLSSTGRLCCFALLPWDLIKKSASKQLCKVIYYFLGIYLYMSDKLIFSSHSP